MNALLQILQNALVETLMHKKSDIVQRSAIGVFVIFLTTAMSFIILFFLALAFYSWMLLYTGPPLAALATAGTTLLLCLITALTTFLTLKSKPKSTQPVDQGSEMMAAMASMAAEELSKSVDKNPKTTLLIAGLAGLLAGRYLK
ncbi:MAG: hypothetical protein K9G33_04050 [Sneathiella sp.]|nr:hypothetical protein [Sneathiella sp.]